MFLFLVLFPLLRTLSSYRIHALIIKIQPYLNLADCKLRPLPQYFQKLNWVLSLEYIIWLVGFELGVTLLFSEIIIILKEKMKGANHNFKQAQTTIQFLLGPIKIKDGLFMGDQFAAKDIQFIISNKVTHVINTVSKSIPNLYQRFGIQYLSVHWTEKEENIFDKKNNAVNAIYQFVEQAMEAGESCLIHSMYGKSRACAVLTAYLMKKYSWSLNKSLEFINSKKEGLEIRNNYLIQMQQLQKRMMHEHKLSASWNEIKNEEDLTLANTFVNAKKIEIMNQLGISKKTNSKRVAWPEKLVQKPTSNVVSNTPVNNSSFRRLKSILKGDRQEETEDQSCQPALQKEERPSQDHLINTINGNVVHVTVNNFIKADKPTQQTPTKFYNTRPFSSDTKDRDKKTTNIPGKFYPNDPGLSSTFKNPYENKMIGKINSNLKGAKKKEDQKNLMMIYDRPISAKSNEDKRKGGKLPGNYPNVFGDKLGHEMLVTNFASKKRYPSTNPKDDLYKWK